MNVNRRINMAISNESTRPLFSLGRLVATPAALAAIARSGESAAVFFRRHAAGDWGDVCADDKQLNDDAVAAGERILSSYLTKKGEKIWIITEADRSVSTLLLPDDY
jgi:hypothetical protein